VGKNLSGEVQAHREEVAGPRPRPGWGAGVRARCLAEWLCDCRV